jgi:cellulose synthase (UDP-forming)
LLPSIISLKENDRTEGLVAMNEVFNYGSMFDTRFNIISLYIPWGDAPQCFLQDSIVNMIYGNGSIPMITWEPWEACKETFKKLKM